MGYLFSIYMKHGLTSAKHFNGTILVATFVLLLCPWHEHMNSPHM